MGILINHSHKNRIIGANDKSIPIVKCPTERMITEVLQSGAWSNQKVTLIGGGPSIKGLKFVNMPPGPKIGINKAFVDYPVDINYGMDARFFEELTYPQKADPKNADLRQRWSNFTGIKLFLRVNRKMQFGSSVYLVDNIPNKVISYDLSVGIFGGRNSGFGALMLAIALGCTNIGLLGYDMRVNDADGRTHWHDGYFHQRTKSIVDELKSMQKKLNGFREEFEEFAEAIANQGVKVWNLNRDSGLNCFPKITIEEFNRI